MVIRTRPLLGPLTREQDELVEWCRREDDPFLSGLMLHLCRPLGGYWPDHNWTLSPGDGERLEASLLRGLTHSVPTIEASRP